VKLLATTDERNPLFTTSAGIIGGAVSFIMPFLDTITHISQAIGTTCGAVLTVWALWEKFRAARKRKLLKAIPPKVTNDPDNIPFS
jgi:hypothetical protein